jgi:hypothetical protein
VTQVHHGAAAVVLKSVQMSAAAVCGLSTDSLRDKVSTYLGLDDFQDDIRWETSLVRIGVS